MNVAPGAPVVHAPSTSTNPFDKKIDRSTKEGISVWKTAMNPDKLLDCIALTVENGDKFLAQMKSKISELWLNKFIQIPTTGKAFQRTYEEFPVTILVNIESFFTTTTKSMKIKSPR